MKLNMQDLYEEMKATLRFFDLTFGEMEQISIDVSEDKLILIYDNKTISIQLGEGGLV